MHRKKFFRPWLHAPPPALIVLLEPIRYAPIFENDVAFLARIRADVVQLLVLNQPPFTRHHRRVIFRRHAHIHAAELNHYGALRQGLARPCGESALGGFSGTGDRCGRGPTALFAVNGTMGLGALKAIDELGLKCPKDVALAVFDEVPSAEILRPHLTAVVQPAFEIGLKATDLLLARIAGEAPSEPTVIVLEPELKVRESTLPSGI